MTGDDTDPPAETEARAIRILAERLERLAGDATLRGERLVDLSVENAALKREIDARYGELAELTRLLDEAGEEIEKQTDLRKEAEAYAEALTASFFWRLTGPLRRLSRLLRGRR